MVRSLRSIILFLLAAACTPISPQPPAARMQPPASGMLSRLPLAFVQNRGQVDPSVAYYARGSRGSVGFTTEGLALSLAEGGRAHGLRLDFVDGAAGPVAEARAQGIVSYFKGPKEDWRTGLPTFERIRYPDLWKGVDLTYAGDQRKLKYELRLAPGADPGDIRLRWRGATSLSLTEGGAMRIGTTAGEITDDPPVAWQTIDGRRVPVEVAFDLQGATYGFDLGTYDPTRPLVIDPAMLVYAGFIGGSGNDQPGGIAVDRWGAAYVAGFTASTEATFPVSVGPDSSFGGSGDAFIAKVAPSGRSLVYAGYIGGADYDGARDVAVDMGGAAYVVGDTNSPATSFPVIGGPESTNDGDTDGFIAKVAPSGASLVYSGYIGGAGFDAVTEVVTDPSGAAYLAGETESTAMTFPVLVGPDTSENGMGDGFVAKVAPGGGSLAYSGFFGGSATERVRDIAVDRSGAAYVTGWTHSGDGSFLTVVGPDTSHNGATDAYVVEVAPSGSGFVSAGFIGGSAGDTGEGIAVDASGAVYVTGRAASTEATFPVVGGPDATYNGGTQDAFVAKIHPSGGSLIFSGYIGGDGNDFSDGGIGLDPMGAVYVAGGTTSTEATFPVKGGPDGTANGSYDSFVTKIAPTGARILSSGFVGGADGTYPRAMAVDRAGAVYLVGSVHQTETAFPTRIGPDLTHNGDYDVFIAKVGAADSCFGRAVTILGSPGNDRIRGTSKADVILSGAGKDVIRGLGGGDRICSGAGKDRIFGGGGKDRINGGPARDYCDGGPKADRLRSCEVLPPS